MITNATITIYNHKFDEASRLDTWERTILQNVHVYVDHRTKLMESGLKSADVYKIRIPADEKFVNNYLPPEEYAKQEYPGAYWTIQDNDQIVIGVCEQKIEKPADLNNILTKHCKVRSWSDNRFGSLPHWRIEGE